MLHLPIINQALELYETQPKWQDKPDKEGWWWVKFCPPVKYTNPFNIVRVDLWKGKFQVTEMQGTYYWDYFLKNVKTVIKWLYIPEPHITNPTPDGGNL